MFSRRASLLITSCSVMLLSLANVDSASATSMSCAGVGIAAPADSSVLNLSVQGQPTCVLAPDGALTLNGTMLAGADLGTPSGTTNYTYDSLNRLVSDTSTEGPTSFTYDPGDHRLVEATDGTISTFYKYDAHGNLIEAQTFNGASMTDDVHYTYDSNNRLVSDTDGSMTFSYSYDSAGLLITQTNGMFTSTYTYDSVNQLTQVNTTIGSTTMTTSYTYDPGGTLHEVKDPVGGITTYTYDAQGNVVSSTDPAGHTTSYTYDSSGRLLSDNSPFSSTRFIYAAPQALPEPGTIFLVGVGVAGLFRLRRKRT
jgi:YD repeat-containing protein